MIFQFLNFLAKNSPFLYLTQSLWRDEAFSVLMSEPPITEIFKLVSQDFNSPFYYLFLHFWMKFFGQQEVILRLPSFIFHLLLVLVVFKFAKLLKLPKKTVYFLSFTTFLNPMLLYYAFEVRMYSLLALLATSSMYFFYKKEWKLYVLVSALGLWTQPFMVFVLLSQGIYLLLIKEFKRDYLFSFLAIFLLFLPWLPVLLFQFSRSGSMWIYPINITTVLTILGNLFTGYEGTPWGLWNKMKIISLIIIFFSFLIFKEITKIKKRRNDFYYLLLSWLFFPVIIVLIVSYFKPIYVNRYLIFVTMAEVFLITFGISFIKNKPIRIIFTFLYLFFIIYFNFWFPSRHKKVDIRKTIYEIKNLARPNDLILAKTPLVFFETVYYFSFDNPKNRSRVFLYNPQKNPIPLYAGANLITKEKMIINFPKFPNRAFLVGEDSNYEIVYQR